MVDSPMFWAHWHQSMSTYSQPSFSSSTLKRGRLWYIFHVRLRIKVKLLLSANRKSYMPRRLAHHGWPWMAVSRIVHTKINIIRITRCLCASWVFCSPIAKCLVPFDTDVVFRVESLRLTVQTTWRHVTVSPDSCSTCQHHASTLTAHLMAPTSHRSMDSSWSVNGIWDIINTVYNRWLVTMKFRMLLWDCNVLWLLLWLVLLQP